MHINDMMIFYSHMYVSITYQPNYYNNALSLDNINMIDKRKIIKYLQLQMELCVKLQNYAVIYDHAKISSSYIYRRYL